MRLLLTAYLPVALFIAVSALLLVWSAPITYLGDIAKENSVASYAAFVGLLFSATVFAPVTVMPIIPVVAPIFGPFVTGVLSVIGWSLGAVVAFLISRYFGRPIVSKFVSLKELDKTVANIPKETRFATIVLIRMSMPVDIVSYALGFIRSISLVNYTLATIIGVSWFSFAFAYLGSAFFESKWSLLTGVGSISLILLIGCWYILFRQYKKRDTEETKK